MQMKPILKHKTEYNYSKIIPFDTETVDGLIGSDLWKIGFTQKSHSSYKTFITEDVDNFIEELFKLPKYIELFAHNLEFDIRFLLNKATWKNFVLYSRGVLRAYLKFDGSDRIFTFQDSISLLPLSQDKLAKSLNVTHKYDIDFKEVLRKSKNDKVIDFRKYISNEDIIKRLESDVIGLHQILENANRFYYKKYKLNLLRFMTLSQFSLSLFKSMLNKEYLNPYFNIDKPKFEEYDFVRSSYFGGRTEVFDLNTFFNAKSWDFNSLYPFVMRNNEFAVGKYRILRFPKLRQLNDFGFSEVTLNIHKTKIPIVPYRVDKKVYFPIGKVEGIYSNRLINFVLENNLGTVENIKRTYNFNDSEKIFKEYIDLVYKNRLDLQAIKSSLEILEKLVMNGGYGKFGQKPISFNYELVQNAIDFLESPDIFIIGDGNNKDLFIKKEIKKLRDFSFIHFASDITHLAKEHQFKTLMKYPNDDIYTDTDNIVTPKHIKFKTGKKLGDLKLEKVFEVFQAFSPKAYIYQMKGKRGITLKGFYHEKEDLEKLSISQILEIVQKKGSSWKKYASIKRLLTPNKNTEVYNKYLGSVQQKRVFPMIYDKRKIIKETLKTEPLTVKEILEFE